MSLKVIIIGDVGGRFNEVFTKINILHQKNNFAFAIIAGSLFEEPLSEPSSTHPDVQDLIDGKISIQVPTYFALSRHALPPAVVEALSNRDGELCENLFYLGRRATTKTSDGVRIVALGGQLDPDIVNAKSDETYAPFYSHGDANVLKGANSADVLITTDWPQDICKSATSTDEIVKYSNGHGKNCIAALNAKLRPRYHFSASPTFFEREPFSHPREGDDPGFAVTRFISLAPYGNPNKQKWIYAFTLDLKRSLPHELPPNCTPSPFTASLKPKRPNNDANAPFSRFSQPDTHRSGKRRKGPPPGPAECFFCFSNPNIAQHLVCAIGEEAYMTMAKGPLTQYNTYPELDFNSHVLIIPMAHAPTFTSIANADERQRTIKEMNSYRTALHSMLAEKAGGKLGGVTWEVSRSTGVHTHWQFLPIPADLIKRGLVEAAFKVEAENENYPPFQTSSVENDEEEEIDCLKLWFWTPGSAGAGAGADAGAGARTSTNAAGTDRRLILPLDLGFKFDLQFTRRVLAKLLSVDARASWRNCVQSEAEESQESEAFKAAFEAHDPS